MKPEKTMKFLAVLNRDGGTLRTSDLNALSRRIRATLEKAGHEVVIEIAEGGRIVEALAAAAADSEAEIVLAGGGDGTVSAAAAALKDSRKALAVLPAGTMNLFARGLGIPLDPDEALAAFASGTIRAVDLASANGRIFIHQFSVGLHPDLVRLRDAMNYRSRIGKIRASLGAALLVLRSPPRLRATLEFDGRQLAVTASNIAVTNNLFGEGHLPYADMPDKGELGIYITRARRSADMARFMLYLCVGRWRDNPEVEIHRAREATLHFPSLKRMPRSSMDGELCVLEERTTLRILRGALNVLVPADR